MGKDPLTSESDCGGEAVRFLLAVRDEPEEQSITAAHTRCWNIEATNLKRRAREVSLEEENEKAFAGGVTIASTGDCSFGPS